MKRFTTFLVASIFLLPATSVAKPPKSSAQTKPPSHKEVLRSLLANSGLSLSRGKACDSAKTDPGDKTLGDYFAGIWQHQTARTTHWLEISCSPTVRDGRPHWRCDVIPLSTDNKEVFWSYGVRLFFDARSKKLDRSEFVCIGAG